MKLEEFISIHDGKPLEVAGSTALDQCVDLANGYIRDCLCLPIVEWTNARDFPSKVSKDDFDYILNTPTGVPGKGDLVIWGGSVYGHIAIFLEGDTNTFTSFDQNWPTGSPCHKQFHASYLNVLGWLHPKKVPMATIPVETSVFESLVSKSTKYDEFVKLGFEDAAHLQEALTDNNTTTSELVTDNDDLRKQLSTQGETLRICEVDKEGLVNEINKQNLIISAKDDEIKSLMLKLSAIPQNETLTPTLTNVISLFRLWLKDWLRNGN